MTETVAALLDRAVTFPDAEVVMPGERLGFAELGDRASAFSRRLLGAGLSRGARVAFLHTDRLDSLAFLLGAMRVGIVPVPVNGRYKALELAYVVGHSGARLLVVDEPRAPLAEEAALPDACSVVVGVDEEGFAAGGETVDPETERHAAEQVVPDDPAIILYTSGTTANPKGCVYAQSGYAAQAASYAAAGAFRPDDRMWTPLPFFHVSAIVTLAACLQSGMSLVHVGARFDPDVGVDQLERERCTIAFPAFETIWLEILNHPRFDAERVALHTVINVGTPGSLRRMQEMLPTVPQISAFGGTEYGGFNSLGHRDDPLQARLETSGHPFPGVELRIVEPETGADLPAGTDGEILMRGPMRFVHYHDDPENDGARARRRRLVPLGRPRPPRRGRPHRVRRPPQGHAQGRRRERRRRRGGDVPPLAPGRRDRAGRRRARRALHGGAGGLRPAPRGSRPRGAGADRPLPRTHRDVQGAALRPRRRRVAHVGDEDPEVQAARADRRRARRGRHHRGAQAPVDDRRVTPYRAGQLIMVSAAVVWSTAGVLQREVEAGPATQVADRAVFAGLTILAAVIVTERRRTVSAFTGLGRWGAAAIVPWAFASSLFILSLNYTTVANVLFWQATAPMLAALLAWLFLSEGIALRTWIAMGLAGVGVVLMVGGGIEGGAVGAVTPFVMTVAFAIVIVLSRRRSDISLAPAAFLSQVLVVVCLGPFAAMASASASDWVWLALLGAIVASGIVLMTIAAQRIPASEIALITLLQIVLGPLLVWLAYREQPPVGTLLGGAVIICAVVVQAVGDVRRYEPAPVAPD